MMENDPRKDASAKALYEQAWERYGARCLWNVRRVERPGDEDAEIVARALRANGDLEACRLADRLRKVSHAP